MSALPDFLADHTVRVAFSLEAMTHAFITVQPTGWCSTTKRRYASEAEGKTAWADSLRAIEQGMATNPPTRVYLCPHCDGWHLTTKPQDGGSRIPWGKIRWNLDPS